MKERVWQRIDELAEQLWQLALRIHSHPELGYEEERAAGWIAEALEAGGFHVEPGVGGIPTALRAVHPAHAPGPCLGVLAEYDALPGLGHACGHNIIAASAVGAALGLAPFKEELPGTLVLLGTPAEEGGGGKVRMIEAGLFNDLDTAFMVHPASATRVGRGSLAISELELVFHGRAAHASSQPEKGINALDAVIQTFVGLNALRQHIADGARVHGIITDGGEKPNIVPERAAARFYVRAQENDYRDELVDKLRRCAEGAALATGASLSFQKVGHEYKAMRPDPKLVEGFRRQLAQLGVPEDEPTGGMGSTDMGDVSWVVPAIHPYIRITEHDIPAHSREFAEASRSEGARQGMLVAAKAMAGLALDLWQQQTERVSP